MFEPNLDFEEVIDNKTLLQIFSCQKMGGLRKSNTNNILVLVSSHINNPYEDKWYSNRSLLLYTGEGQVGDQKLDGSNLTLYNTYANPSRDDPELFLFEKWSENKYTYLGPVEVADEPYVDQQKDINSVLRNVWIFPIKMKGTNPELPSDYKNLKNGSTRPRKDLRPITNFEVKKTVEKCCYANSMVGFFNETKEEWLQTMQKSLTGVDSQDLPKIDKNIWEKEFDFLHSNVVSLKNERPNFNIVFEYRLPYSFGRRPDIVLISNEQEIIIEFTKEGKLKSAIQLVNDYINDLREKHPSSKGKSISAIVISNEELKVSNPNIQISSSENGYEAIKRLLKETTTRCNLDRWLISGFSK